MEEELKFSNAYDDCEMHVSWIGDGIFVIEIWQDKCWNIFHLEGDNAGELIKFLQKNTVGTKERE